jgi:predicted Ser/Thr protein kinase
MAPPRIISMDFSTNGRDDCYFRIQAGTNVKYITIQAGALDAESLMDMPLDFQNILPSLPYDKDDWNSAYITRHTATDELEPALSQTTLPRVQTVWDSKMINFLDLERTKLLSLLAQECKWKQDTAGDEARDQQTMIAKMARFPWEIQYIEAETRIYQLLQPLGITPTFFGHIYEAGRVIGVLLEKVEGRPANLGDLEICKAALQRLHDQRILHGDCNRYNFIITPDEKVTLIDFDNAKVDADAEMMEKEMASLEEQLREETGRGGGFIQVESDDESADV